MVQPTASLNASCVFPSRSGSVGADRLNCALALRPVPWGSTATRLQAAGYFAPGLVALPPSAPSMESSPWQSGSEKDGDKRSFCQGSRGTLEARFPPAGGRPGLEATGVPWLLVPRVA